MEVYSGSLFVPVNPTDPLQNPVSTTEGSVWGPRQALTGGAVLSIGKVTVCTEGRGSTHIPSKQLCLTKRKHRLQPVWLN
ncbi:hypothetical protein PAMP_019535 [Pampus punctatissimus]